MRTENRLLAIACLRFYLLLLAPTLALFEWQFIAAQTLGDAAAGTAIGMATSLGTLVAALVVILFFRKRACATYPYALHLLVVNSAAGLLAAAYWGSSDWPLKLMLVVIFAQNVIGMFVMADEVAFVSKRRMNFGRIRSFGSLGFLTAAILSQCSGGGLLWMVFLLNIVLAGLHRGPDTLSAAESNTPRKAHWGWNPSRTKLYFLAFLIAMSAKGYAVIGPLHLRSVSQFGLIWLSVLILCEFALLQLCGRVHPKQLIVLASIAWIGVYLLLVSSASTATLFAVMILLALNCPAQTAIQIAVSKSDRATSNHQAVLASVMALGGFCASAIFATGQADSTMPVVQRSLGMALICGILMLPVIYPSTPAKQT